MKIAVIGAGITGLATSYLLTREGIEVILIEKGKVGSGMTTHNAGQLHSGGRYVTLNQTVAKLCKKESAVWDNFAPFAISGENAVYACLDNKFIDYEELFLSGCKEANIKFNKITSNETKAIVKGINSKIRYSYLLGDRIINPFLVIDAFIEELKVAGCSIFEQSTVKSATLCSDKWKLFIQNSNQEKEIDADFVINCSGSWLLDVLRLFEIKIEAKWDYGTMLCISKEICDRIVTKCAPYESGNVIIPSGNKTLVGSSSYSSNMLFNYKPSKEEVMVSKNNSSKIIPSINKLKVSGSFTGSRIILSNKLNSNNLHISKEITLLDHAELDGIPKIISVLPGKLTVGLLAAKLVANRALGNMGYRKINLRYNESLKKPNVKKVKNLCDVVKPM